MIFIETKYYTKVVADYLTDEEQAKLAGYLIEQPDAGAVIQHTGGIRKVRWTAKGRGKSGGVRVIYYWRVSLHKIYLLTIYGKNESSDLTHAEKTALKKLVEEWD